MADGWRAGLLRGWRKFVERRNTYDIIDRLRSDAAGPDIHIDYYRQDAADALAEIQRLRKLVAALATIPASPSLPEPPE